MSEQTDPIVYEQAPMGDWREEARWIMREENGRPWTNSPGREGAREITQLKSSITIGIVQVETISPRSDVGLVDRLLVVREIKAARQEQRACVVTAR